METLTTAQKMQKIKRMEAELAELKKQLAEEIKAAKEAEMEKRNHELGSIQEKIEIFNTKYGTEYTLATKSSLVSLFPAFGW